MASRVLCIRHGESTFNAAYGLTGADPLHFDAPLSERGHKQVAKARVSLRTAKIELVITTPLTRALQTTQGLFADHPSSPPVIVEPLHREKVENSCDIGRSPSVLRTEFPAFAMENIADIWWHDEGERDARGICIEPVETVQARAQAFRAFLRARPEDFIAVVGHGTFFFHLTGRHLLNCESVLLKL